MNGPAEPPGIGMLIVMCLMAVVVVALAVGLQLAGAYAFISLLIADPLGTIWLILKGVATITVGLIVWGICIVAFCLLAVFLEKTWMKQAFGSVGSLLLIMFIVYLFLRLL